MKPILIPEFLAIKAAEFGVFDEKEVEEAIEGDGIIENKHGKFCISKLSIK